MSEVLAPQEAPLVRVEVAEAIATLTLNRPERRNALSPALVDALLAALAQAQADPRVRAIVLTGAGDRAFCAGGDLGGMQAEGALAAREARGRFAELLLALHRARCPVIAALNGDALGGGFGLALACDLVVARAGARLGTPELKLGLFPMIILAELVRCVPRKALCELIFTARLLDADEALGFHLLNRVVPADALLAETHALASRVASFSPAVLRLGKEALYQAPELAFEPGLRLLHGLLEANLSADDAAEGISAFLGRREPQWSGR